MGVHGLAYSTWMSKVYPFSTYRKYKGNYMVFYIVSTKQSVVALSKIQTITNGCLAICHQPK